MGVTIHFNIQLADLAALRDVIADVRRYAKTRRWPAREFVDVSPLFVECEESSPADRRVSGVEVLPDEWCEPVRLEFGADVRCWGFVKTQFAGVEVHRQVIGLFDEIAPRCASLRVDDEGEYWETRDASRLAKHIATCDYLVREMLKQHPRARGPVRIAGGRWADVVS